MNMSIGLLMALIGAIVLVFSVFIGYRRKRQAGHAHIKTSRPMARQEPTLRNGQPDADWEEDAVGEFQRQDEKKEEPSAELVASFEKEAKSMAITEVDIVELRVLPQEGRDFSGYDLLQGLLVLELRHGEMDIFHRQERREGNARTLFSVASVKEPGTFNIRQMSSLRFPGVTFFMQISQQEEPETVFEEMVNSAVKLAKQLEGRLLDGQNQELNPAMIEQIRQRIVRLKSDPSFLSSH